MEQRLLLQDECAPPLYTPSAVIQENREGLFQVQMATRKEKGGTTSIFFSFSFSFLSSCLLTILFHNVICYCCILFCFVLFHTKISFPSDLKKLPYF